MVSFVSESGSLYVLDTKKKTIEGGELPYPMPYADARALVGEPVLITLRNGEKLTGRLLCSSL